MIASRTEILKINPFFSTFLIDLQDITFNPMHSGLYKEGNKVWLDEKSVVLTSQQAQELNQENIDRFNQQKDILPFEAIDLKYYGNALYKSNKTDAFIYINELAVILDKIMKGLNETSLLMMGLIKTKWFQENGYPPVKKAMDYLKEKIATDFEGGFILSSDEVLEIIPHIFWLIRCNASLPELYISFPTTKTVCTICKYGIIHFEFYDEQEKALILNILEENNFSKVERCYDPIDFDDFEGRKLNV